MRWAPHLEVSYCTNVHPGEGLSAVSEVARGPLTQVKRMLSPDAPLGTGLRLGAESVAALRAPARVSEFAQTLDERSLYVFSVNGFPYGDFAAPEIKAAVYQPDWSTDERARYTLDLARVMTQLPGPKIRSISTVAGGFQPDLRLDARDDERGARFTRFIGEVARGLYELEEETGVSVRVALEPEPWTSLERAEQVGPFFERYVWPSSPHAARYWGLCYDTCHQALAFEDPLASWTSIVEAGVPIYKVQISNALRLTDPRSAEARAELLSFAEPRYLHQVNALTSDGEVLRALDLPELKAPTPRWLDALEWRCHFHVPIWWGGERGVDAARGSNPGSHPSVQIAHISTTRAHWETIAELIRDPHAQPHTSAEHPLHVEVETYSWGVLPVELRQSRDLIADICAELNTLRAVLDLADRSPRETSVDHLS